jgi:hypothetical protein
MSVSLSIRLSPYISASPTAFISVKLYIEKFIKTCPENPDLFEISQRHRALGIKPLVHFTASGGINSP